MKSKKRWIYHQVDTTHKPNGYCKTVADLTETEAKDELCNAMDLITKMLGNISYIKMLAEKENYIV